MRLPVPDISRYLAIVTIVLMVCLLPVVQFLDTNHYFKFKYGFDQSFLGLVVLVFGVVPLLLCGALVVYEARRGGTRILAGILGVGVLFYVAQLYSTSFYDAGAALRFGAPALLLAVGFLVIRKGRAQLTWALALASLLVVPYVGYSVARHWWLIPKPPAPEVEPVAPLRTDSDTYVIFIDGCKITSDHLDAEYYPDPDLVPNLHRFIREDAQWFHNAVSNGPDTSRSLPSILTGKLYASRKNNFLANEETIFSILRSRCEIRGYLHTRSCLSAGEDYELCFPFREPSHREPLRILAEGLVFLSTFRLSPLSYEIGQFQGSSYSREAFVGDFLASLERDSSKPRFYAIQIFDRSAVALRDFDRFFADFVETLERTDRYESSTIILLSDHGVVRRKGRLRYGSKYAELPRIYRVPFAVKLPGRGEGRVYDYEAQGIDILPTILARLLPESEFQARTFEGVDVLTERPPREHYINLHVPGQLFRLAEDAGPGIPLVEVPLDEVELRSARMGAEKGAAQGDGTEGL